MNLQPGIIIKSTDALDNTGFDSVSILLTEVNEKGALGFIVNKTFPGKLNELVEFTSSPAFPLFNGGPVDQEHLYFIHQRADLISGGAAVTDTMFYGGDFKQAITHINTHSLTSNDIKIFVGYCGWDAGELEAEIEEGSWEVRGSANLEIGELAGR